MDIFTRYSALAAILALLTAVPVRAQYVPPRVEVARLPSAGRYPSLEPSDVVIGDCRALSDRRRGARLEELGAIHVTVYTQWYVGAQRLA
ncbi:MAG: hypothetical protein KGL74_11105, partial [Elusimicrobia bacterium]|nr:hypothetical protein [Elusimicrobiota bacterium]